jgi:hypothetical protein
MIIQLCNEAKATVPTDFRVCPPIFNAFAIMSQIHCYTRELEELDDDIRWMKILGKSMQKVDSFIEYLKLQSISDQPFPPPKFNITSFIGLPREPITTTPQLSMSTQIIQSSNNHKTNINLEYNESLINALISSPTDLPEQQDENRTLNQVEFPMETNLPPYNVDPSEVNSMYYQLGLDPSKIPFPLDFLPQQ